MNQQSPSRALFTWAQLEAFCSSVADQLKASETSFDTIVAIGRGGAFPGLLLSHALDIPQLELMQVQTHLSNDIRSTRNAIPRVVSQPSQSAIENRVCLLVDDVTNTGDTLRSASIALQSLNPRRIISAVLIWDTIDPTNLNTPLDRCEATFYAHKVHAWVDFPWERSTKT